MAVFVSGRGSNLQALLDQEGCNIRLVCSHLKLSAADLKSKRNFIPVFKTKKIDFLEWLQVLKSQRVNRVFLLGFMRIVPGFFVDSWKDRMLNLHPSLLPLFPGLDAFEKSYEEKTDVGVTIHKVTSKLDAGEIVAQSMVFKSNSEFPEFRPSFATSALMMSFREHYLVRRVGEKWN